MEPAADAQPAISIASTYNEAFCRRLVRKWGEIVPDLRPDQRDEEAVTVPAGATFPFPSDRNRNPGDPGAEVATLDFWNNGEQLNAVRIWFDNGRGDYFDGMLASPFPVGDAKLSFIASVEEVARLAKVATGPDKREFNIESLAKNGWWSPLPLDRHASWRLFQLNGVTYVLGLNGVFPSTLYRPQKNAFDNTSLEPVCVFQSRGLNY
jgi:hypothetical protein